MPGSAPEPRSPVVADADPIPPAGLSAVLAANRPQLVRFFTGRTGSVAEAEDVVQEIWLHVAEPMTGYVEVTTSVMGAEAIDDAPSAFDAAMGRERLDRLVAALSGPPEGAMRVFRRHRIDGASHAEIAAELGISRSAVEKHVAVALRHLRKALDD